LTASVSRTRCRSATYRVSPTVSSKQNMSARLMLSSQTVFKQDVHKAAGARPVDHVDNSSHLQNLPCSPASRALGHTLSRACSTNLACHRPVAIIQCVRYGVGSVGPPLRRAQASSAPSWSCTASRPTVAASSSIVVLVAVCSRISGNILNDRAHRRELGGVHASAVRGSGA